MHLSLSPSSASSASAQVGQQAWCHQVLKGLITHRLRVGKTHSTWACSGTVATLPVEFHTWAQEFKSKGCCRVITQQWGENVGITGHRGGACWSALVTASSHSTLHRNKYLIKSCVSCTTLLRDGLGRPYSHPAFKEQRPLGEGWGLFTFPCYLQHFHLRLPNLKSFQACALWVPSPIQLTDNGKQFRSCSYSRVMQLIRELQG